MGTIEHFKDLMSESVVGADLDDGKILKHFRDDKLPPADGLGAGVGHSDTRFSKVNMKKLEQLLRKYGGIPDGLRAEMSKRLPKSR